MSAAALAPDYPHTDPGFVRDKMRRDGHAVVFAYNSDHRVMAVHSVGLTDLHMPEVLLRMPGGALEDADLLRAFRAVDRIAAKLKADHGLARHGLRVNCASGTYLLAAGTAVDYEHAACAHTVYAGRLVEVLTMTLDLTEEI